MNEPVRFQQTVKVDVLTNENEELIKQFMIERYDIHREESVAQGCQCVNTTFTILVQSTWVKSA